jgi:hypothetical protein
VERASDILFAVDTALFTRFVGVVTLSAVGAGCSLNGLTGGSPGDAGGIDATSVDAGSDATSVDAGSDATSIDAGVDAGPCTGRVAIVGGGAGTVYFSTIEANRTMTLITMFAPIGGTPLIVGLPQHAFDALVPSLLMEDASTPFYTYKFTSNSSGSSWSVLGQSGHLVGANYIVLPAAVVVSPTGTSDLLLTGLGTTYQDFTTTYGPTTDWNYISVGDGTNSVMQDAPAAIMTASGPLIAGGVVKGGTNCLLVSPVMSMQVDPTDGFSIDCQMELMAPAMVALEGGGADALIVYSRVGNTSLLYTTRTAGIWSVPTTMGINVPSHSVTTAPLANGGAIVSWVIVDPNSGSMIAYSTSYTPDSNTWSSPVVIAHVTEPSPSALSIAQGVCGDDAIAVAPNAAGESQVIHYKNGVWGTPAAIANFNGATYAAIATTP